MSFPITTELILAPSFNEDVLGAMTSFVDYFEGSYLDPENDGFKPILMDSMYNGETLIPISSKDLGLRMHYICGHIKTLVITLVRPSDMVTKH
jgi:hypothetical protein